jgi:predicted PurR-regulated permease PerM
MKVRELMKDFSVKYRDKLATAAFLVIVITGLKLSSGLIMPFIFALFLAVITMPIVHVFKQIKLPHSLSVLASLTVVMSIMIVIGQFFYSSSKALTSNLKEYYEMFLVMVANLPFFEKMQSYGLSIDSLKDHITPQKFVGFGVDILGFFSTFSASFFLVIIITAFMLVEIETIKSKVNSEALACC